jgi:hypothetical protein
LGDEVSLCREHKEFARAIITSIKMTTLGKLKKEDKEGHEKFKSDKEMYRAYSAYYGFDANKGTEVKVIKFRLV